MAIIIPPFIKGIRRWTSGPVAEGFWWISAEMLIPNLRNQISLIQELSYKRDAKATFLVFWEKGLWKWSTGPPKRF